MRAGKRVRWKNPSLSLRDENFIAQTAIELNSNSNEKSESNENGNRQPDQFDAGFVLRNVSRR